MKKRRGDIMDIEPRPDATGRNTVLLNKLDMDMDFKQRTNDVGANYDGGVDSQGKTQFGINVLAPSKTSV